MAATKTKTKTKSTASKTKKSGAKKPAAKKSLGRPGRTGSTGAKLTSSSPLN